MKTGGVNFEDGQIDLGTRELFSDSIWHLEARSLRRPLSRVRVSRRAQGISLRHCGREELCDRAEGELRPARLPSLLAPSQMHILLHTYKFSYAKSES